MKRALGKIAAASLTAVAVTLFGAGQAQAATVFQSFSNFATIGSTEVSSSDNCSSCGGAGELLASFTLDSSQTLNKAFVLASNATNSISNITVSIFSDGGNDLPATNATGGIQNPFLSTGYLSPTLVTSEPRAPDGLKNYLVELALPDWQLNAGKYWIRFAGSNNSFPLYETSTPALSRAVGSDFFLEGRNITFNPQNRALGFSLNGVDAGSAVPEPGTWLLMLVGFGFVGSAMRKRSSVSTALSYA